MKTSTTIAKTTSNNFSRLGKTSLIFSTIPPTIVLLGLIFALASCKQFTEPSSSLHTNQLLHRLPETSAAFSLMDFDGKGFQNAQKEKKKLFSQKSKLVSNPPEALSILANQQPFREIWAALVKAAQDSGLIDPTNGTTELHKFFIQGIYFISSEKAKDEFVPHIGFIGKNRDKNTARNLLASLKQSFTKEGLHCNLLTITNKSTLTVTIPKLSRNAFFVATDTFFGFATNKEDLTQLSLPSALSGRESLVLSKEYLHLTHELTPLSDTTGVSFISYQRIYPLLQHLLETLEQNDSFSFDLLPIDSILIQDSFSSNRLMNIKLGIQGRNKMQNELLKAFDDLDLDHTPISFPSDTALAFKINTLVTQAQSNPLKDVSPALSKLSAVMQALLVGFRANNTGSPLPDIFFTLSLQRNTDTVPLAKEIVNELLRIFNLPPQWGSKKIGNTSVDFFTTLIGAGIYIAQDTDSQVLLASTSETGMRDLLDATQSKRTPMKQTFGELLTTDSKQLPLSSLYIDFDKTASLVDSISGTLSMMTGGASQLSSALDTSLMRSAGHLGTHMTYSEQVLSIRIAHISKP
jgi:hypothetical protein